MLCLIHASRGSICSTSSRRDSARESASLAGGAGVAQGQRGELMAAVASDSSAVVVAVVQPTGIAPAQGQSGNVVAAVDSASRVCQSEHTDSKN